MSNDQAILLVHLTMFLSFAVAFALVVAGIAMYKTKKKAARIMLIIGGGYFGLYIVGFFVIMIIGLFDLFTQGH